MMPVALVFVALLGACAHRADAPQPLRNEGASPGQDIVASAQRLLVASWRVDYGSPRPRSRTIRLRQEAEFLLRKACFELDRADACERLIDMDGTSELVLAHARRLCSRDRAFCKIGALDESYIVPKRCPLASSNSLLEQCRDGFWSSCGCVLRQHKASRAWRDAMNLLVERCTTGDAVACEVLRDEGPDSEEWDTVIAKTMCYSRGGRHACLAVVTKLASQQRLLEARVVAELACQLDVTACYELASMYRSNKLPEPRPGRWRVLLRHACRYETDEFRKYNCHEGQAWRIETGSGYDSDALRDMDDRFALPSSRQHDPTLNVKSLFEIILIRGRV